LGREEEGVVANDGEQMHEVQFTQGVTKHVATFFGISRTKKGKIVENHVLKDAGFKRLQRVLVYAVLVDEALASPEFLGTKFITGDGSFNTSIGGYVERVMYKLKLSSGAMIGAECLKESKDTFLNSVMFVIVSLTLANLKMNAVLPPHGKVKLDFQPGLPTATALSNVGSSSKTS
jgi:hypothetical protein